MAVPAWHWAGCASTEVTVPMQLSMAWGLQEGLFSCTAAAPCSTRQRGGEKPQQMLPIPKALWKEPLWQLKIPHRLCWRWWRPPSSPGGAWLGMVPPGGVVPPGWVLLPMGGWAGAGLVRSQG